MIHPLFKLLVNRPELFVEHAGAYAEVLAAEARDLSAHWQRRVALLVLAVSCTLIAMGLSGVAVLLASAIAWDQMPLPWLLVATPLVPLALGLVCALAAQRPQARPALAVLRDQMALDAQLIEQAGRS
jgi:hypothetical protein